MTFGNYLKGAPRAIYISTCAKNRFLKVFLSLSKNSVSHSLLVTQNCLVVIVLLSYCANATIPRSHAYGVGSAYLSVKHCSSSETLWLSCRNGNGRTLTSRSDIRADGVQSPNFSIRDTAWDLAGTTVTFICGKGLACHTRSVPAHFSQRYKICHSTLRGRYQLHVFGFCTDQIGIFS